MQKGISKYRSLESLLEQINIDDFKNYYIKNTRADTEKYFNLAPLEFAKLAKEFNMFNFKRESKRYENNDSLFAISKVDFAKLLLRYSSFEIKNKFNISTASLQKLKRDYNLLGKKPVDLLELIVDKDALASYYSNNGFTDTCRNFSINNHQLHELLFRFDIHERSKESDYDTRKATFLSNYGKIENPAGYLDKLNRYKKTMIEEYGAENPAQVKEFKDKAIKTLKKYKDDNHMHQSSKYEIKFKQKLEETFGRENIIYQHIDFSLYPFNCDFYIKPLDLWLELNGWWHHGIEPFINSDEQLLLLEQQKVKYPNQAYSLEKVWTRSDPEKFEYAKRNNLNYLAIYDNGSAYNFDKKLVIKFSSLYRYNEIIKYLREKLEDLNINV